ncbi:predicted protein [Thalassiosira pseudonana CCMP1335]|uniref:Uncharacterized protein n=1 Tax=Thalassiosira pseudonana TaxID=35128 RepID=B8LDP6_THAPS|nr:predicted protein [Thalassiosira pseudonana CCMP1335]EED86473.1 predicted protein [Thalassiosira pseudonana CCMP1335]
MEQKEEGTKKDRFCKSLSHHHQQRRVQTVQFHERTVREDIVPSEEGTVPCCWGWVAAALVQEITDISSNGVPRMPPRHGSGASLSSFVNEAGGGDFSALDATIGGGTLELDGGDEVLEVEGEWVGVKKCNNAAVPKMRVVWLDD